MTQEEKLKLALKTLHTINNKVDWEVNPDNYSDVDVYHLNSDWIEVGDMAEDALKKLGELE